MAAELPLILSGTPLGPKRMVSGTDFVAMGVGGTGVNLSAGGGTGFVLKQAAGGVISSAALIAADIPSLAGTIITSGLVGVAVGGSGADLSATGGANQVVRQSSVGGAFTVSVLAAADIPNLDAAKITTGAIALARGGTGVDLSAGGGATMVLAQDAAHVISARNLIAADIPSHSGALITSGLVGVSVGGSGANLSATGGANQIVRQSSVGGAFTVSVLAAADIPAHSAALITSGTLAVTVGGTGANLSATGGANQIVRQNSSGGAFTVSILAAADIPNLDTAKITTGTFAVARLGSGSAAANTYVDGGTGAWTALPSNPTNITLTNGEATAFIVGNVVYSSATGTAKKAQANALATSRVVGLTLTATAAAGSATIQTGETVTLTTGQWDALAGTTGGLTFGTPYFLSAATAGLLTPTAPSTTGQQWVQVGIGLSTTQMEIQICGPIGV